ncbi:uncharacterized protein LOC141602078 [Silene latifolia]|uniref:uncharacterized protein LOC141602078 n=1 Tax=Silene latifolia TaxID=37657 RepID=UPI003D784B45
MKLTHLMFADDLLLFGKGDAHSIMVILRTFSTFSKSSGLKLSKGKTNAYFNGVKESLKSEILHVSGFIEGTLPFKYPGVPIKTTRLNAHDCRPLIEKIVNEIRGLGTRKLSYAGRLILVKAVLKTYQNYWASMFILPNGVLARIQSICRNFVRAHIEPAYRQNVWTVQKGSEYTIARGYEFLRNKNDKVSWAKFFWNNMTIPKHNIIAWLYHHNALNTQEKLQRLGITGENTSFICGSGVEIEDLLFFECVYSTQVIVRVGEWLEINLPCTNITDWRTHMMGSSRRQALLNATINACMYHLW